MNANLDRYKADLEKLLQLGDTMNADLMIRALENKNDLDQKFVEIAEHVKDAFEKNYQRWYTEASAVVHQIIPDRLQEFLDLYRGDIKRKKINTHTFTIHDWMTGVDPQPITMGLSTSTILLSSP